MEFDKKKNNSNQQNSFFLLIGELQLSGGRVQVAQNVVPIVYGRQVFGRVSIDVQRKNVDAKFNQEIDAMNVSFGCGQMQSSIAKFIGFIGFTAASAKRRVGVINAVCVMSRLSQKWIWLTHGRRVAARRRGVLRRRPKGRASCRQHL